MYSTGLRSTIGPGVCEDPEFLHRSARTREGWAGLNRSGVLDGMSGAAVAAGCVAKEAFPLGGSSLPPGGGTRIKVRAWEPRGEVESRLRPRLAP